MSAPLRAHRARAVAFYLPQFHSIPENDEWWGSGFTEWTNVRKARPLFEGHAQPRQPGELGYYDLLNPDARARQAELAAGHGVEAFCYWHYWFAGKRLLERPFEAVLRSGEPQFDFCLAWANHSWTASWVGRPWQLLIDQTYPGRADYEAHYASVRDAFGDPRYVLVDGRPLFVIFRPQRVPEPKLFTDTWRELAHRDGFPGLHLLGICDPSLDPGELGLDGTIAPGIGHLLSFQSRSMFRRAELRRRVTTVLERRGLGPAHQLIARAGAPTLAPAALRLAHDRVSEELLLPLRQPYGDLVDAACHDALRPGRLPCVTPNWDNTPRVGRWGTVLEDSTPEAYARHLEHAVQQVSARRPEERLVFLKSWNEWAEGNYLEPDNRYGRAFLEATRDVLSVATPGVEAGELSL
ncbi:MAG: glycoside hydrolase family 99-like domain-containing protein [Sandaracinaceae bacterium]